MHPADPTHTARLLARGALAPVDASRRFEIAVLLRLLVALEAHLEHAEPGRWTTRRCLVLPGRREVAVFERADGASLALFFDQAMPAPGPRDRGVARYLGVVSRLRPDLALRVRTAAGAESWVVFEVKLSDDLSYLAQGFGEAVLYAHEYAALLRGWPRSLLVTSCPLPMPPCAGDDVIAVGWDRWVPEAVLAGLVHDLVRASTRLPPGPEPVDPAPAS